jgi:hypothetical protein
LGVEPRLQPGRSVDCLDGAAQECDGPFLLGELIGKGWRNGDLRLERGAAVRRNRPIGEGRQLGDSSNIGLLVTTPSHPHDDLHRTSGGAHRTARHECL